MIFLRDANESDLPLILAWRSQEKVYQGFYQQKAPLEWEEHKNWWASRNSGWKEFIIVLVEDTEMRDVGVVTIGQLDHWSPELGVMIGEVSLWNKGLGTEIIKITLEWLQEYAMSHHHITACHTTILDNNIASIKLFKKCGFERLGVAREGESWYQKQL